MLEKIPVLEIIKADNDLTIGILSKAMIKAEPYNDNIKIPEYYPMNPNEQRYYMNDMEELYPDIDNNI